MLRMPAKSSLQAWVMLGVAAVPWPVGLAAMSDDAASPPTAEPPAGMKAIPGGVFLMGSDSPEAWPAERPAHRVRIDPFWIDETEVTNAQFRAFVEATGYLTTAERKPDWEELK
jgi:sulfatase modifying factor 1